MANNEEVWATRTEKLGLSNKGYKLRKQRGIWGTIKDNYPLYFLALPGVVLLFIFNYLPMVGLIMAFQKMDYAKGIFGSPFNGFKNFEFLFTSTDAPIIVRNTLLYNLVFLVTGVIAAVTVAIMLSELHSLRGRKVYQTILIMPHFLSWAVVALLVQAFIQPRFGYFSNLYKNWTGENINFMITPSFWPPFLVFLSLWKGVGYSSVMYLAAIAGIDQELYEAAMLDGASKWQQTRFITLPSLRPMITILTLINIGGIFRGDFGLFYLVTQDSGRIRSVTNVMDTYIYRGLMELRNPNMSTAAGLFQSLVGMVTVLISNRLVSKVDPDNRLF